MSSGTNVEVNATSMTPSAPVGGADALAPLTAALDNLHTTLTSIETTLKGLDLGGAIRVALSNEFSAFTSSFKNAITSFETILLRFTNNFIERLDNLLSNIKVTATKGIPERGEIGEATKRNRRNKRTVEDDDEEENPIIRAAKKRRKDLQFERDVRAELETRAHSRGTLHEPWKPFNRSSIPNKLYSTIPKVPMSMRSEDDQFKAYIDAQQKRGRFKDRAIAEGFMPGPLSKMDKQVKTVEEEVKDLLTKATRRKEVNKLYNEQAASMGLPPRGPNKPTTAGAGGFDWKKLLGAAGLGFAFTGGAGVAAAAIVKLLPKVVKAFEPVIDLGNALVDSLDPLAETVNTALTPFRDLANQLKRFSVLGGFGASFNMNRINAQFESNLNDLMSNMLDTISSIFSNPLAGIMNAASMIGKFVDMVDPAAMSAFQQTMRDTFAVIGTALRPAMIELTRMLRSFADHLHPVLQGAMPRILSGLQAMAEAFERNIPLITLMLERFLGDITKQVDQSGRMFGEELKPETILKGLQEYNKPTELSSFEKAKPKGFWAQLFEGVGSSELNTYSVQKDRDLPGLPKKSETLLKFESTLNKILMVAGKEGGIEKNKEFLNTFLKSIVDKEKLKSTVGLARVTDASYGGVAEVGREAVRRAFEGSRLQDLTRQNNREDIEQGTYAAFKKALDEFKSGEKIYGGPPPEGIHSGTQFYPKPVR
jgi:hypothetical protein